jgi:AraC-like DNA-binding protein
MPSALANLSRSRHQPRKRKPGPVPVSPSDDDRRRVEIGVAGGLSVAALARVFDMPRTSFNRTFAKEIENGRARLITEMGLALYKAATRDSNVAAAKALLQFVERSAVKPEAAPDRWAGLADRINDETVNLGEFKISRLAS